MRFVNVVLVLVPVSLMVTSCGTQNQPPVIVEDSISDADSDLNTDTFADAQFDARADIVRDGLSDTILDSISDLTGDSLSDAVLDAHNNGPEIPPCVPDCTAMECGLDLVCGQVCGVCENGLCVSGICTRDESDCLTDSTCSEENLCWRSEQYCNFALDPPLCQKTACADVGSSCSASEFCISGVCDDGHCLFQPDCTGLECGPDPVAGVSCGQCADGHVCESGTCVCVPDCSNSECGPDPVCGTDCGQCATDLKCREGQCTCSVCGPGCGQCPDIQWMPVAGGSFQQGCEITDPANISRLCAADELPRHRVTVPSFSVSRFEITVDQFKACIAAGACLKPASIQSGCNGAKTDRGQHPMNCVKWDDAADFCMWAGGRLGSESEWEYAARGTDNRLYPWGNQAPTCKMAWSIVNDCSQLMTHPVGLTPKGASPFGIEDMSGNVSEWVADPWHSDSYAGAPTDGSVWTSATPGVSRVCRGGGFNGGLVEISARNRMPKSMNIIQADLGIRCFK